MPYPTPHESFKEAVATWAGGWQNMPEDAGNWINCNGRRVLVGTMRDVTPAALAHHLGIDPCTLTPEFMQETVTLDVAADIGVKHFYKAPGYDDLEWSPLVALAAEIGWGSGTTKGVKMLQQLIGATADGVIGPQTRTLYAEYINAHSMREACTKLAQARRDFYTRISQPGTPNHRFRQGWYNRADYYSPSNPKWWDQWIGWRPSGARETGRPIAPPEPPPPTRRETATTAVAAGTGAAVGVGAIATQAAPLIEASGDLGKYIAFGVAAVLIGLAVWKFVLPRLRA